LKRVASSPKVWGDDVLPPPPWRVNGRGRMEAKITRQASNKNWYCNCFTIKILSNNHYFALFYRCHQLLGLQRTPSGPPRLPGASGATPAAELACCWNAIVATPPRPPMATTCASGAGWAPPCSRRRYVGVVAAKEDWRTCLVAPPPLGIPGCSRRWDRSLASIGRFTCSDKRIPESC
jgi:hypothetical protein